MCLHWRSVFSAKNTPTQDYRVTQGNARITSKVRIESLPSVESLPQAVILVERFDSTSTS